MGVLSKTWEPRSLALKMAVYPPARKEARRRIQVELVARKLERTYHTPQLGNKPNPLDELLYILISLRTVEAGLAVAYRSFKQRFPSWSTVARARRSSLSARLRPAGLADQKSRYVKAIVGRLIKDFGRPTLEPLRGLSKDDAEIYLTSLPGVGVKTARCVIMFSFGIPAFPVDVHCLRIMKRLGWLLGTTRMSERTANEIEQMIPEGLRHDLHLNLVAHGRSTCRPIRPHCERCSIVRYCNYGVHGVLG
jgi:endonuclease III